MRGNLPHLSGRKVGGLDMDAVGVQRPVAERLRLAEFLLGQFRGVTLAGGIDFHRTLADFALPAVLAKHVLQEPNDISWHGTLLTSIAPPTSPCNFIARKGF